MDMRNNCGDVGVGWRWSASMLGHSLVFREFVRAEQFQRKKPLLQDVRYKSHTTVGFRMNLKATRGEGGMRRGMVEITELAQPIRSHRWPPWKTLLSEHFDHTHLVQTLGVINDPENT